MVGAQAEVLLTSDGTPILLDGTATKKKLGARFDIRTGKATSLPAVLDIPSYPVRVTNGMLELGLPKR